MEEKMNAVGQVVIHKVFGTGVVSKVNDERIIVHFIEGEKKFIYPDVFEKFLTPTNDEFAQYVNELIAKRKPAPKPPKEDKVKKEQEILAKEKILAEKEGTNVAFKCNFCDGGKSRRQIGFNGICSEAMIENNIEVERRSWCSDSQCECFKFYSDEISRDTLEKISENTTICYESELFKDWKNFDGYYVNSEKIEDKIDLSQVEQNSLCVLTTVNENMSESERYIIALFIIDEVEGGNDKYDALVKSKIKYKLKLSPKQSEKMLFWKYFKLISSKQPTWDDNVYKYFSDKVAVEILEDMVKIKKGTKDEKLAKEMLEYYCKSKNINSNENDEPKENLSMA